MCMYIDLNCGDCCRTVSDLTSYLSTYKGLNFLKSHGKDTPRFIKKQGLDQTFYECENHLWRIGRRPLPTGIRVDGGSDWVCLYRDFARYIINEKDELLLGLRAFYKYTLLPAEVRDTGGVLVLPSLVADWSCGSFCFGLFGGLLFGGVEECVCVCVQVCRCACMRVCVCVRACMHCVCEIMCEYVYMCVMYMCN